MKKTIIVLSVLVVLVVVAELSAPYVIARGMEMGLNRTLGANVKVRLTAYPSLRLLLGQFETVSVVARNVKLGGLQASEYALVAQQVDINMRELLARREIKFIEQGKLEVRVTINEGDLSKYLWEQLPALKGWRVQINDGAVVVWGQAPLLNATVELKVSGGFKALGTDKIAFVVDTIEVQGTQLPAALVDSALQGSQFYIDLKAAPMPLELIDVKMEPGKLVVRAKVLQ